MAACRGFPSGAPPSVGRRQPLGSTSDQECCEQSRQTGRGASVRVRHGSLRGSSCRQGAAASSRDRPVLANGQQKATSTLAKKEVGTQTELPKKYAAVQVSGCRECQSFTPPLGSCRDSSCVRREQVEDLLCMVAEL